MGIVRIYLLNIYLIYLLNSEISMAKEKRQEIFSDTHTHTHTHTHTLKKKERGTYINMRNRGRKV